MEFTNWLELVSAIFLIISIVCGLKWKQAKELLKELAQALTVTSDAVEDDDITHHEREAIIREWKEVIQAAKKLIGRP